MLHLRLSHPTVRSSLCYTPALRYLVADVNRSDQLPLPRPLDHSPAVRRWCTSRMSRRSGGRWQMAIALPIANIALGLVVIAIFVWRVDVLNALRNLPDVQWRWATAATLTFTGSKVVHAYRWKFFLRHRPEISFRQLLKLFLVSNLANAVLPLRAGDLLRVELPNRRHGIPRAELASSVFLVESLLDGVAFVLLAFSSLLLFELPPSLRPVVVGLAVVVLILAILSTQTARRPEGWSIHTSRWRVLVPPSLRAAIDRWSSEAVKGMRSLSTWRSALIAVVISLVAWMLEVAVWWLMGRAFGIELVFSEALLVMIAANMAGALPLTPWNIGPYEVVVTEILVLFGYTRLDASSYAIGTRILLIAWIGVTGLLAMWSIGLSPRDLHLDSANGDEPAAALKSTDDAEA